MKPKPEHIVASTPNPIVEGLKPKASRAWKTGFICSVIALAFGIFSVFNVFSKGLGVLGLDNQIVWGIIITNFVFWIGVSHAGTFISAILLLLRQNWRKSINRIAESMTIVAIITALIMPVIHLGKPELFYKIFPFKGLSGFAFVNFASPLSWDFYAIGAYLIVSILIFQTGLLPDWGYLRDAESRPLKIKTYNILSFGWNGSLKQWLLQQKTMLLLAMLVTPLVISVHSIVSLDFAVTKNPGWHSTLFPLYFVTGAVMSGFTMIISLIFLLRSSLPVNRYIHKTHLNNMNKIVLFTGCLMILFYAIELFSTWQSGNPYEQNNLWHKAFGHFGWLYFLMLVLSLGIPQLLWIKKIRTNFTHAFIISILINTGLWIERFSIVVQNSESSFSPGSQAHFSFTIYDLGLIFGSLGLFLCLFYLLIRYVPFISIYENLK